MVIEKVPKVPKIYRCEACNYSSVRKSQYERHLQTDKHKLIEKGEKITKKFEFLCLCGRSYKYNSGLCRHTSACNVVENDKKMIRNGKKMVRNCNICECGKTYQYYSGLSRHKRTCTYSNTQQMKRELIDTQKQSSEHFQTKLIDAIKEVLPQIGNTVINNHNQNKYLTTNQINVYLNGPCADAMSIQEFSRQLEFTIEDMFLEKQEMLMSVIRKNLAPLALTKRPVHCSSVKRRKWYVKDENEGWQPDDGKQLVDGVEWGIQRRWITQYEEAHPNWQKDDKGGDNFMRIVQTTASSMPPKAEARFLASMGEELSLDGE